MAAGSGSPPFPDGGGLDAEEALDLLQQPGGDGQGEGDAGEALGDHRAAGEGAAIFRSADALVQHVHGAAPARQRRCQTLTAWAEPSS